MGALAAVGLGQELASARLPLPAMFGRAEPCHNCHDPTAHVQTRGGRREAARLRTAANGKGPASRAGEPRGKAGGPVARLGSAGKRGGSERCALSGRSGRLRTSPDGAGQSESIWRRTVQALGLPADDMGRSASTRHGGGKDLVAEILCPEWPERDEDRYGHSSVAFSSRRALSLAASPR